MGNWLVLSCLPDHDFADHKALAHLDQVAVSQEIVAAWLAQEIDIEAGGHRQWLPTDRGKHRHVDRIVAERHDGGARDRRPRAQRLLAEGLAKPTTARPDLLDGKATRTGPHLRKLHI